MPAARQTDVFANGQVQVVEFDVEPGASASDVVGRPLREATLPADSRVASIIRGGEMILPLGSESLRIGDRIVVIGSPPAAREWSALMSRGERTCRTSSSSAPAGSASPSRRMLLGEGIGVRLVEADRERARIVSQLLPKARVLHATGTEPDFLERERVAHAQAAIVAMRDDAKNLYVATLAQAAPACA